MTLSVETKPLRIYIGWDSREDIAYQVAKLSIEETASVPVEIIPLKQGKLKKRGWYWRSKDVLGSTEFTFTRFLVPALTGYTGWALFIDCDFVALDDVKKLFDLRDEKYAVMCAQHDYTPKEGFKMDGQAQLAYPRKNWSSMMLFNCSHPSNKALSPEMVNDPDIDGKYLHRFSWLKDSEVGAITHEWNWLVGWYKEPTDGKPKFLHYTEGGPWFPEYEDCEYADEYYKIERKYLKSAITEITNMQRSVRGIDGLDMPDDTKELLKNITQSLIDPEGKYYGKTPENTMKIIQNKFQTEKVKKVATIFNDDLNYEGKPYVYDEYLESLAVGINATLSDWQTEKNNTNPIIIRGVGKSSRDAVQHCWKTNRDFYAIDTGYFGNNKSKSKGWHRITKNALQNTGPIIDRPHDRLLDYRFNKFKKGSKILLVPPSEKVMMLFNQPSPEEWVKLTMDELKKYTDRPIEIRMKPIRQERISTKSMEQALADDVHCLVTYNSIAALEALMNGKPAIALGPNCASVLCNTSLAEVENLNIPDKDEMIALMAHLSYCQFSRQEMMNGYAWDMVNESS